MKRGEYRYCLTWGIVYKITTGSRSKRYGYCNIRYVLPRFDGDDRRDCWPDTSLANDILLHKLDKVILI